MVEEKTTLVSEIGANLLKKEIVFTVPDSFDHESQLDLFQKKVENLPTTYFYSEHLKSKNFLKVSDRFIPKKSYKIEILEIKKDVISEACINFLLSQNALLVGAQGLTILFEYHPEIFIKGKFIVSFDRRESLYTDISGSIWVPYAERDLNNMYQFDVGYFEGFWDNEFTILCVTELM